MADTQEQPVKNTTLIEKIANLNMLLESEEPHAGETLRNILGKALKELNDLKKSRYAMSPHTKHMLHLALDAATKNEQFLPEVRAAAEELIDHL